MSNPVRKYYDSGNLQSESWFKNGKYNRIDGPAFIRYYKNGNIEYEQWMENNKFHRINYPALIWYYENGNIQSEYWFINGIKLTDKEITVIKRKLKLCQIQ